MPVSQCEMKCDNAIELWTAFSFQNAKFGFASDFDVRDSDLDSELHASALSFPSRFIDEMNPIPQSSPTMSRLLGIWLALATATLATFGQTNPPVQTRELSLQDC